jgi:predicted small lipoprotein YifL
MRRVLSAVMAIAAVFAMSGARCGKVPSERPPAEREVDSATAREVIIRVQSDNPYVVDVTARELGRPEQHEEWREPVASGEYVQTLTYTSGLAIRITVNVQGKMGDRITCSIADGEWNVQTDRSNGHYRCYAELITLR